MKLESGDKLVMIGDSISDCGRARPVGEGRGDAAGTGYIGRVASLLGAVYPERRLRVVSMGQSGNTVRDLKARWQTDVLDLRPDWVSVMIGINDVWRQFDLPQMPERAVPPEEYEETLADLVTRTLPMVRGMVLMTPYFIEAHQKDPMRARMNSYGAAVRRVAEAQETLFVDTQAAFDRVLAHLHPAALAWDRVHPGPVGHMVLARAFLGAVGFSWAGAVPEEKTKPAPPAGDAPKETKA